MARWWTEPLDPERHCDFMRTSSIGGESIEPHPTDRLLKRTMYFVEAAGFTFQFASLNQLREALAYFEIPKRPSTREPGVTLEHYWQRWYERLPGWLSEGRRRQRVAVAFSRALREFESDKKDRPE